QESPASRLRNSTARNSAATSPQNARTRARLSGVGLMATTRKIAARVSGAATGCATTGTLLVAGDIVIARAHLLSNFPAHGQWQVASRRRVATGFAKGVPTVFLQAAKV